MYLRDEVGPLVGPPLPLTLKETEMATKQLDCRGCVPPAVIR
jgi:hypothetical protein